MSTTTKSRGKVDLHAMIGPLTQEPEPKTLEECLQEAGGFPFVARATVPSPCPDAVPVGCEIRCINKVEDDPEFADCFDCDEYPHGGVLANIARWFLVGHKT